MTDMSRLITDNLGALRGMARRYGGDMHEDVLQEACTTILRAKSYNPTRPAKPWLFWHIISARNLLLRDRYRPTVPLDEDAAKSTPPTQEAAAELSLFLHKAAGLPERQRRVCELVATDHTDTEAGAAMGISRQAAAGLMRRARGALKLAA